MTKSEIRINDQNTNPQSGYLVFALFLCISATSFATVRLPLQGYYRPGQYIPVQVDPTETLLQADGAFTTVIESKTNAIVPFLIYGLPTDLNSSLPLRPVSIGERLIASDVDAQNMAQPLFPGDKIIPIALNPAEPLPGPPVAWESLDAIVLNSTTMQGLVDSSRSVLLAAGVILVSVGDSPPDFRWPWKHRGSLWLLSYAPAGPSGQLMNESVFSPTYDWAPGWPPSLRAQIIIAGALFGIGVIALALWKTRFAPLGIILLATAFTLVVIRWRHFLPNVNRAGGDVVVVSPDLIQRDSWVYERARDPGIRGINWSGSTHPIMASIAQFQPAQMRIIVSTSGSLAFEYRAIPGETISFVHREVQPSRMPTTVPVRSSPLEGLAKDIYLSAGSNIAGEQSVAEGRWNTVIVDRPMPASNR